MKKADDVFHVGVGVRHLELPHTGSESVKRYNHFTKSVTGSCKSEHVPVLGPTVPLLRVSQEEWKRVSAQGLVHKQLCLHTTPKRPPTGEGIHKRQYFMQGDTTKPLIHGPGRVNLKSTRLNKRIQTQKSAYCVKCNQRENRNDGSH